MTALFPAIAPYSTGFLETVDGHHVFFALSGNPAGRAALLLHGGPGSGLSGNARRYFDPAIWHIVQFDQRGCGQSTPNAGLFDNDLRDNTTAGLIADIEALRRHLGVEDWLVFGASWGSTLALAYAQSFPGMVTAMILAGVTMTRQSEIDWLYSGLARFLPEAWERFSAAIPPELRDLHPVAAYHALLNDADPAIRQAAALEWHLWEAGSISADPLAAFPARWRDPAYILARARLCTHYFHHRAWLEDGQLLRDADRLSAIPGILIQGRLDLQGPPATAFALHRAWSASELVMIEDAGHSTGDAGMADAIAAATARLAAATARLAAGTVCC